MLPSMNYSSREFLISVWSDSLLLAAFGKDSVRRTLLSDTEPRSMRVSQSDTPLLAAGDVHLGLRLKLEHIPNPSF